MTRIEEKWFARLIIAVGVLVVGLFLFAAPAEAHGAHTPEIMAVDTSVDTDHAAHGHLGHCHGGAFCPGAGVFAVLPLAPKPLERDDRLAVPGSADGATVYFNYDPPPPRNLI